MLNKFNNAEVDLPPTNPKFAIMEAWAEVSDSHTKNFEQINHLITESIFDGSRRKDHDANYAAELEHSLQQHVPSLSSALDSLRSAMDKVNGWHITWRHWSRGDYIGMTALKLDNVTVMKVERGPNEYYENQGWIIGSRIGADAILGGIGYWIEIDNDPTSKRGMSYGLEEMFAIELSPPS